MLEFLLLPPCAYTHTHLSDFVLAFQLLVEKEGGIFGRLKKEKKDTEERRDKRKVKRDRFIESCKEMGLEFELQDCSVSHFVYSTYTTPYSGDSHLSEELTTSNVH